MLHDSATSGTAAVNSYEEKKRNYLNTTAHLQDQDTQFLPMIVDGHSGSWGPTALRFFKKLARHAFTSDGIEEKISKYQMMQ